MGGDIGGFGAKAQSRGQSAEARKRKRLAKTWGSGTGYSQWMGAGMPQALGIADPLVASARRSAESGAGVQQAASAADFARYGQGGSPAQAALGEAQGWQGTALGNQALSRLYQQMMEDTAQQAGRSTRGFISGLGGMPMPSYAQTSQQGYAQAYTQAYLNALSAYLAGGMGGTQYEAVPGGRYGR